MINKAGQGEDGAISLDTQLIPLDYKWTLDVGGLRSLT